MPATVVMFPCPKCEWVYGDGEALQKHLKNNHPDRSVRKRFSCDHPSCDYSADCESWLNRHMVKHTGVRAFKCNYQSCGKDFTQQRNLNCHIKTVHKRSVKYTCPDCFEEFSRNSSLIRHKSNIHDEAKPNVCRYCRRRFGERSTCNDHEKICKKRSLVTHKLWRPWT